MSKRFFISLYITVISTFCLAQVSSNFRAKSFDVTSFSLQLDSLSIIPSTWNLSGLDSSEYAIDFLSATLFIYDSTSLNKKINVSYRTFQYNFSNIISHKSTQFISPKREHYAPYIIETTSSPLTLLKQDGSLHSSGSIARGITIGNSQNFSLQSSLNLQLSGHLSEEVTILANITDKNIPIQPEGNTRYIQDFNKIFIELQYKNLFSLVAGDITIKTPSSYYLRVNRNVLGLSFSSNVSIDSNNHISNMIGGGIQKGKFTRNDITPLEGVQGPYQLHGQQQETNIMIISGSERVYMDGHLLIRGSDQDYTIDYNVGEITFSHRHLMNPEKRIIIVFEYTDFSYSRYVLFSYNHFQHEKIKKLNIRLNFYQEHDLKNHSIQPELSFAQKRFLSEIGDQLGNNQFYEAEIVPFSTQEVLYKKTDTLVYGSSYPSIYVHTTNPADSCYRVKFTFVGDKKGNYRLSNSATTNGRLFEWVAPIDSIPQGNYEPILLLTTPKLQQMVTMGADFKFGKHSSIAAEFALSNYDKNCFSKKDDENNVGFASKLNYTYEQKLFSKKNKKWNLSTQFDYQFLHRNFQRIESFRDVEFSRMYNLNDDYSDQSEQMAQIIATVKQEEAFSILYKMNLFSRLPQLHALRNELSSMVKVKRFHFNTTTAYLHSKDNIQETNYFTTENHIRQEFKSMAIGMIEKLEYNVFHNGITRQLRPHSFAFNDISFYIQNGEQKENRFKISYKNRIEHAVNSEQKLIFNHLINEIQASTEIIKNINQQIRATLTYRNVSYKTKQGDPSENHFIGSVQYNGRFFKNAILLSTFYETGSSLEPKRSYHFLKVMDGQGTHVWNDYNGNGIEELDEFELATFKNEANYIKVLQFNNEYINAFQNQLTQTLQLNPYTIWYNKKGILKFLSRFANVSSLRIVQKNSLNNVLSAINPFSFNLHDSLLITQQLNFKNVFSFNKNNSYFGIDFIIQRNQMKNLLYYGIEQNKYHTEEIIVTGTPHSVVNLRSHYLHGKKENISDFFSSRNYILNIHQVESGVLLQFSSKLFCNLSYLYQFKHKIDDIIRLHRHQLELSTSYKMPEKGTIMANLKYSGNQYNSEENNSLAYEMLEGLQKGDNFLWGVAYQSYIGKFLEIDLLYEGRTAIGGRTIHSGRVQMRAHF